MSTDRELLELAAKAASIEYDFCRPDLGGCQVRKSLVSGWWNPLTDDGDALRLVVKLRLHIGMESHTVSVWQADKYGNFHTEVLGQVGGAEAALRRAIVRAAAEIGKAMQ